MGLIGFILCMFGLGVIIFTIWKDPSKPTLKDFKEGILEIEGPMAIVLRALYILSIFNMFVILPFMYIVNFFEKWLEDFPNGTWHPCEYVDYHLKHDGTWVDGRWYEWKDKDGNIEIARMKLDTIDHFFPRAEVIKEEDVVAFRETKGSGADGNR